MDWLTQQAQSASPFIASFCLLCLLGSGKVIKVLWDQIKFEREEHRKAEIAAADAAREIAVSHVELSKAVDQLTATLTQVIIPAMLNAPPRNGK